MADPFLAEIRIASFNFAPQGWAFCNGQFLPINQNQALFSLLGTTYGGNGQTTFALPDLRTRVPIHFGSGTSLGEKAGTASHTINTGEMPAHFHVMNASSSSNDTLVPTNTHLANTAPSEYYSGSPGAALHAQAISNTGGSQPHENRQPSLVLSFCIALQGIFPSQN